MTNLHIAVEEYVGIRRALGFKLQRELRLLNDFVDFVESEGAATLTTELALRWAMLPSESDPGWWWCRLSIVRCFARYMSAIDPSTEIPPMGLLTKGDRRATPYLYSDAEIVSLLAAARTMRNALTAATCETLIGLLAITGMRIGEALRLNRDDVDWTRGLLSVSHSKFDKSREIPLHSSTLDALAAYERFRDERCPHPRTPSFFVSNAGSRLTVTNIDMKFQRLLCIAGISPQSPQCRPHVHGLRHSFACRTLEEWYRRGVEVQPLLPILSTYLGHSAPSSTYWYISGKPELMVLAAERLETSLGVLP